MNARSATCEALFGVAERFRPGDYRRVDAVLDHLQQLGVRRLRTPLCAADFHGAAALAWQQWLAPALAGRVELLPCIGGATDATFADDPARLVPFTEAVLQRVGAYFSTVELAITPQSTERDPRLDPAGTRHADALTEAVQRLRAADKRVVLTIDSPALTGWLELLGARGLLREITAVGLQGAPSVGDLGGQYWFRRVERVRELLVRHGSAAEVWITETGYGNDGAHDAAQVRAFLEALDAPVQRFYWSSVRDDEAVEPETEQCGLYDHAGAPRLLSRLLADGGPARLRELLALSQRGPRRNGKGVALITGGAGFIGTNLAARLLAEGRAVRILDSLSRPGTEQNLRWLSARFGEQLDFRLADVRDRRALREAVSDASEIYHFAAQVAVTTSLVEPLRDLDINGRGTLNLLEELRRLDRPPPLLFTSTNKVYGGLEDLPLHVSDSRYDLADPELRARGIDESRPLAFCSPYGCSKGAADQYVLDYANTFQLPASVLRMSCIYGPHQFGTEDQGWVAHFLRRAAAGLPIVIYGDGRQVRDILFVEDLVDAMLLARDKMDALRGQAFNLGGGPRNTVSLRELLVELERLHGRLPEVRYEGWRASDQRYYVSDVTRFHNATGWSPRTPVREGLERLHAWLADQRPAVTVPERGRVAL